MPLPISIPDIADSETLPSTPTPQTGFGNRVDQFGDMVENSFDNTGALFDPELAAMKVYNPGPIVQNKELPENLQAQYPNGVGQNVLQLIRNENQHNDMIQQQLSYAPSGALTKVSGFSAGIIGTMLAPQNALIGALAPEALPERLIAGMGLESTAGKFIAHGLSSAAVGEGVNTGMNLSNYYYNQQLGNNPQVSDLFNNWILAGGLGFLGGGIYSMIKPTRVGQGGTDSDLLNTGVKQANADKQLNLTPQVQQAKYEAGQQMRADGYDPVAAKQLSDHLSSQMDFTDDQIDDNNAPDSLSQQTGLGMLNKVTDNLANHLDASEKDRKFNDDTQSLDYFQRLVDTATTHPDKRTDESQAALDKFSGDPFHEAKLIQQTRKVNNARIKDTQSSIKSINKDGEVNDKAINKLNQKMGKLPTDEKNDERTSVGVDRSNEINDLSEKKQNLEDHLQNLKQYQKQDKLLDKRSDQLDALRKKAPTKLAKGMAKERLRLRKSELQNMKDHEDGLLDIYNTPAVSKDDVLKSQASIRDPKTDIANSHADNSRMDEEIADVSEPRLEASKNKVLDMVKKGLINQSLIDEVEETDKIGRSALAGHVKLIDDYMKCIGESSG